MDALCSAFETLATGEGGRMPLPKPQGPSPPQAAAAPTRAEPYRKKTVEDELAMLLCGLTLSAPSVQATSELPIQPTPTGEFIGASYSVGDQQAAIVSAETLGILMTHVAADRDQWMSCSLEECRQTVALLAEGSYDEVPYRVCSIGESPMESPEHFLAPFAFVAPSPDPAVYGREIDPSSTVVYVPKVRAGTAVDLYAVLADIECKFNAHWEYLHLRQLGGTPQYHYRVGHTLEFVRELGKARSLPGRHPPRLRPPSWETRRKRGRGGSGFGGFGRHGRIAGGEVDCQRRPFRPPPPPSAGFFSLASSAPPPEVHSDDEPLPTRTTTLYPLPSIDTADTIGEAGDRAPQPSSQRLLPMPSPQQPLPPAAAPSDAAPHADVDSVFSLMFSSGPTTEA